MRYIYLLFFVSYSWAASDEQLLADWTKDSEAKLLDKYQLIKSDWFQKQCMTLAKGMEFSNISQCFLFKSQHINAYVFNNGHVYFSSAMLKQFANKHQWASVLAHENAHIVLQHYLNTLKKMQNPDVFFPKRKIKKMLKKHEKQADDWAQNTLLEFGLDPAQISYFLKRVVKSKGSVNSKTHLKLNKRIKPPSTDELIDLDLKNNIKAVLVQS